MKSTKILKIVSIFLAISLIISLAACGEENESTSTPSAGETSKTTESAAAADTPFEPMAKYDPVIEVTACRASDDSFKFAEGESFENNIWSRAYESELGIKIKYNWIVSPEQYETKINVSIASDDLADIMPVNVKYLQMLVDNDSITDLTEIYDKYALPFTKEVMTEDMMQFNSAKYNGKLMALPYTGSAMDNAWMLWVRTDWLKKLNLPEPKTFDDILKISEAFTNQDPDGNKKKDTFGLGVAKVLDNGFAGLSGLFNSFHAYPKAWIKDASGNLVYGSVQPEARAALQKLQEMFKAGQIDREFGVKDAGKVAEDVSSNKIGMFYGLMWNPLWPLQSCKDNNPDAQWQAYPLISTDGKPASPQVNLPVAEYYVINKNFKHPEAAVKMLNLAIEKVIGKTAEQKYHDENGIETFKYILVNAGATNANLLSHYSVVETLKTKDPSGLGSYDKSNYDKVLAYLNGDNKNWGYDRVFGETGSFVTIDKYVKENLLVYNEFYGAPTQTMAEKNSTLTKMEDEVFTKIILGASIEEFDKFVNSWKTTGGDQITEEVNAWYAKKN